MCREGGSRSGHGYGCRGARVEGFIRPCLLLLLSEQAAHGYELMEGLARYACGLQVPDTAAVYRNLRWLEEAGYVTSRWDTGGPGPARRMYSVTASGKELLCRQADELRLQKERLELFLKHFERISKSNKG